VNESPEVNGYQVYHRRVRVVVALGCLVIAACGGGGGEPGAGFVAATVDGQSWRASGQGSFLTTANGQSALTILGFTPLPGSTKQADMTKPTLEFVFSGELPAAGSYDVATTSSLSVTFWPDQTHAYGASSGAVVIASISAGHADGTFAFTAVLAPSGPDMVAVSDGSFSVPISAVGAAP